MSKCYRCKGRRTVINVEVTENGTGVFTTEACPQCAGGPKYRHPQNQRPVEREQRIDALTQFYASDTPTPAQTHLRNLFLDKGVA